jgi:hypothetical protein
MCPFLSTILRAHAEVSADLITVAHTQALRHWGKLLTWGLSLIRDCGCKGAN